MIQEINWAMSKRLYATWNFSLMETYETVTREMHTAQLDPTAVNIKHVSICSFCCHLNTQIFEHLVSKKIIWTNVVL